MEPLGIIIFGVIIVAMVLARFYYESKDEYEVAHNGCDCDHCKRKRAIQKAKARG
jgi:hypothetical protein